MTFIIQFIASTAFLIVILLIARQFEKRTPLDSKQSTVEVIMDWKLAGVKLGMNQLLSPLTAASGVMIVNAMGGGWIHLRSDGLWFLFSLVVIILAIDLSAYLVHRAEHKFPVLWAMHSLHHSAESLTVVTGARHFWLEEVITRSFFPVLGIIFKVPPEVATTVAVLHLLLGDGLAHLNMPVSLGRFALCIQNPQYHRIHHSVEPQHQNKNFCKLLPLFDVIFGTAWKPGEDEFPKTGLESREKPSSIVDGIIWPIRHRLGRNTVSLAPGIY